HMGEIEQIVGDELVIALHMQRAIDRREMLRVLVEGKGGDCADIGPRSLARPYPDEAIALGGGPARDMRIGWNRLAAMRIMRAAPVRAELQTMIAAFDMLALHPAQRQRREAMRTAIRDAADL